MYRKAPYTSKWKVVVGNPQTYGGRSGITGVQHTCDSQAPARLVAWQGGLRCWVDALV